MNRAISELANAMEAELDNILTFWGTHAVDRKNGGFVGSINGAGLVNSKSTKGTILNARILWTFSAAYRFCKNDKYLELANRAYEYFTKHFFDKKNGGVFWELDYKGNPTNKRKQAYAQGFAIYGLSEYYRATQNEASLLLAQELFWTIEKHFYDKIQGGYIEALSEDWSPLADMRLSTKDANEPKSMNTHLHLLEPYTNLYRCWKNPILENSIQKLLGIFMDKIIDDKTAHFNLFFGLNWEVKSNIVSFGHDIEGAWLLSEAAEVIGNKEKIEKVNQLSLRMVEATRTEGTDADGSVFYEREGTHLDTDKHWWPQAEAMVGYIHAWQLTSKRLYLDEAERVWNFIKLNLVDPKNGEWFWRVDQNGNPYPEDEKTGFWKCPYHNTRALIEVVTRLKKL